MKTPRVRIYYPFFPYPPSEGSFYVVYDQIRALSLVGFEVEVVCWKDSAADVEKKLKQTYLEPFPEKVVRTIVPQGAGTESSLGRLFRVVKSLNSNLSSPELLFYPPS